MRNLIYLLLFTSFVGVKYGWAESRHYHTSPTLPKVEEANIAIPLIEVDPDTGEKRVYLRPSQLTPEHQQAAHTASARYPLDGHDGALHQAISSLHGQMNESCPAGWLKLKEWAVRTDSLITLYYAFACLD